MTANGSRGDRVSTICNGLRRAILEGALRPGDRLPEDALGDSFGVSRTISRQVLTQLAGEGLVELRRNRIATVWHPTPDDARDIFDIRVALERQVAEHLAGRLSDAQVDTLRGMVAAETMAKDGAEASALRLAIEFHVVLAQMTGRPVLIRYVTEICHRACLALLALGQPISSECSISEHLDLIQTIRQGPADRAADALEAHLVAVTARALIQAGAVPVRDLASILAPYAQG